MIIILFLYSVHCTVSPIKSRKWPAVLQQKLPINQIHNCTEPDIHRCICSILFGHFDRDSDYYLGKCALSQRQSIFRYTVCINTKFSRENRYEYCVEYFVQYLVFLYISCYISEIWITFGTVYRKMLSKSYLCVCTVWGGYNLRQKRRLDRMGFALPVTSSILIFETHQNPQHFLFLAKKSESLTTVKRLQVFQFILSSMSFDQADPATATNRKNFKKILEFFQNVLLKFFLLGMLKYI